MLKPPTARATPELRTDIAPTSHEGRIEMTITIYGASDDLIEVEGAIREEFTYNNELDGDLLGFSDGTLLRIYYDAEGIWRITPISQGSQFRGNEQATTDNEKNYSDRATLGDVAWVMHGDDHAKAATR